MQGVSFCSNLVGFPLMLDFASWKSESYPVIRSRPRPVTFLGFRYDHWSLSSFIVLPYWFLVLATGSLSAVLWWRPKPRFSLPILLIVTTILAAVLAIVVELDRPWIGK